jgi:[ribosomal protein S5]-alanine N-acetyltransferase
MSGTGSGPVLFTERLVMRPLQHSDLAPFHALLTEPGVRRYLLDDAIVPEAQARDILHRSARLLAADGAGLWGIALREQSDLLGCTGYWDFHEPPRRELLYLLSERAWGNGYATEAARRMIAYGRDVLRLPAILASTDLPNRASIRVLERLGFRQTEARDVDGRATVFFELPCA